MYCDFTLNSFKFHNVISFYFSKHLGKSKETLLGTGVY